MQGDCKTFLMLSQRKECDTSKVGYRILFETTENWPLRGAKRMHRVNAQCSHHFTSIILFTSLNAPAEIL